MVNLVVWLHMLSSYVLTNVTLASSNCTLPDDGDNTETCWSCFNLNFDILLKQLFLHQLVLKL